MNLIGHYSPLIEAGPNPKGNSLNMIQDNKSIVDENPFEQAGMDEE